MDNNAIYQKLQFKKCFYQKIKMSPYFNEKEQINVFEINLLKN